MSSGWPGRPSGVLATAYASNSPPAIPAECVPSVMTKPGLTPLTRIFRGANSFARDLVIESTAPFVPT